MLGASSMYNINSSSDVEPSSNAFMRKGILTNKRFPAVRSGKKFVILCHPTTTDDLYLINREIIETDETKILSGESKSSKDESIRVLGQIALAAVSGTPLLILGTSNRQFIHFSDIEAILDEDYLQSACNFHIVTSKHEVLRFSTDTSTDYQLWISALREALTIARSNVLENRSRVPFGAMADPIRKKGTRSLSRRRYYDEEFSDEELPKSRGGGQFREREYVPDYEDDLYYEDDHYYRRSSSVSRLPDDTRSNRSRSTASRKRTTKLDSLLGTDEAVAMAKLASGGERVDRPSRRKSVGRYPDDDKWDTSSRASSRSRRRRGRSVGDMFTLDDGYSLPRSGTRSGNGQKKGFSSYFREE
ncbi:hypothetical protein HK098_005756 [Nowakowskiella sp. JEL0407]|nr:hypothetical protein HK098_005756 [Nowakowskiella sp. JEL0407]